MEGRAVARRAQGRQQSNGTNIGSHIAAARPAVNGPSRPGISERGVLSYGAYQSIKRADRDRAWRWAAWACAGGALTCSPWVLEPTLTGSSARSSRGGPRHDFRSAPPAAVERPECDSVRPGQPTPIRTLVGGRVRFAEAAVAVTDEPDRIAFESSSSRPRPSTVSTTESSRSSVRHTRSQGELHACKYPANPHRACHPRLDRRPGLAVGRLGLRRRSTDVPRHRVLEPTLTGSSARSSRGGPRHDCRSAPPAAVERARVRQCSPRDSRPLLARLWLDGCGSPRQRLR